MQSALLDASVACRKRHHGDSDNSQPPHHIVLADGLVLGLALGLVGDLAPVQDDHILEGRLLDLQRLEQVLKHLSRVRHDAAQRAPHHCLRTSEAVRG